MLWAAFRKLESPETVEPVHMVALWVAMAALVSKELLFRYMLSVAKRVKSSMLVANAWHARADALSSLVVAAGIAGALIGFNFADAVAAIIVGAMIVRAGFQFAWAAIRELIDTGLSGEEVEAIRTTIGSTPGVLSMHELRTRRMAHQVLVDAHVQVNPRISVSEGHRIAESARQRVLDLHPEVLDVLVHVDAENDLLANAAIQLPDRAELLAHLRRVLDIDPPEFERTMLHYLGTRVEAEVFLPAGYADEALLAVVRQRVKAALAADPWFSAIRLNQQIAPK
jgi:divalent metal cation (Fe/Co/Zn/Cd) transporter